VPLLVIAGWMYDHMLHIARCCSHYSFVSVDQLLTLHFHNFEVCLFRTCSNIIHDSDESSDNCPLCICLSGQSITHVSSLSPHGHFHLIETSLACFRDGKANYMEGLMLLTLYLVIALACKLLIIEPLNHILKHSH
jgi:hypothetical protein